MNFLPGGMTFEEYFQVAGHSAVEKSIRFLVGFAPSLLHRTYLVDPTRVNLQERRGPSTGLACQLCAGVATGEAVKILIGRGKVRGAPRTLPRPSRIFKASPAATPAHNWHDSPVDGPRRSCRFTRVGSTR